MTQTIVYTAKAFTLKASDDGTVHLDLGETVNADLFRMAENGASASEAIGAALDAMDVASKAALLDAMAELIGMEDTFAGIAASGDMGALTDAIQSAAESRNDGLLGDTAKEKIGEKNSLDLMGSDLLPGIGADTSGTSLDDMLNWGMPEQSAPSDGGQSGEEDDGGAAIAALIQSQEGLMIGWGAAVAVAGLVAVAVYHEELHDAYEAVAKKIDEEVNFIPADPDESHLTEEEFYERIKDELDPTGVDPKTTMPADPDAEFTPEPELDESDIDDLDELTQPVSPDGAHAHRPDIDTDDPMGLDPLINPGHEPENDVIVFKDFGGGGLGGGGEDFVAVTADIKVANAGIAATDVQAEPLEQGAPMIGGDSFDFI